MTRLWFKVATAFWLLAHSDLVMADIRAVPVLRQAVATLTEECDRLKAEVGRHRKKLASYDRAWAALGSSRGRGRHLFAVTDGEQPAA